MTTLPTHTEKSLGLVIDLDTCVGCHACVTACKGWNTENYGASLADTDAYGADPVGSFLNRVHSFEVQPETGPAQLFHFPKSCLHCADAPCVTVCPTGASYKRVEDGIVLVNESDCIGCGLCAWACPYGAREMDPSEKIMKKCTLCVDRIYNENLPEEDREPACVRTCPTGARHFGDFADPESNVSKLVAERGGIELMPEQGTAPVNFLVDPSRWSTGIATKIPLLHCAKLLTARSRRKISKKNISRVSSAMPKLTSRNRKCPLRRRSLRTCCIGRSRKRNSYAPLRLRLSVAPSRSRKNHPSSQTRAARRIDDRRSVL